ncbi:MAG: hypothetical protein HXS51_11165 [Theionarchaea archaeon]|nr:hypothetical protein [Theionarchaea archaeon]
MIALVTMILSFLVIYRICWRRKTFRKMVLAYFFFLLSAGFAVLREYMWYDVMRETEHILLVISSSIFLYITYVAHKNLGGG